VALGKARGAHNGQVSTERPAHNPYKVRLSELTRFRPMTATRHSPLDDARSRGLTAADLTGELVDEPEERPSMLTIEGEIWGFGKVAQYAATGTGPKAARRADLGLPAPAAVPGRDRFRDRALLRIG